MYRILLVDDEILVRDAIRENIDWKAMDCELVGCPISSNLNIHMCPYFA